MRRFYLHPRAGGRQGYTTTWLSYSNIIQRYNNLMIVVEILTSWDEGDCLSDIVACNVSLDRMKFLTVIFLMLPSRRRKSSELR